MNARPAFTKIEVQGQILLGSRHDLIQAPQAARSSMFSSLGARTASDMGGLTKSDTDGVGEVLEFKFSEPPTGQLHIADKGLVTSFGIFGAPGSGKTVLLVHLLKQLFGHSADVPDRRYGALILDPKAALIGDVRKMAEQTGRADDLVVINTDLLNHSNGLGSINVIDCLLDPYELGSILVLAGRSAGIDASDPFWFQEWTNLFAASLSCLRAEAYLNMPSFNGPQPVTLLHLLNSVFDEQKGERAILRLARSLPSRLSELPEKEPESWPGTPTRSDVLVDLQTLERFYRQDYVGTVEAFVTKAFGMFRRSRLECYSKVTRANRLPFYEDIIENGRIVLVSASPSEPALAKTLCTLMKCLFQRTVLARGDRTASGILSNAVRPLVIACDEYSEIASEVAGQSMGDGQFLALARQYGCMALLATQSVNVLEATSLKETWRSVFSNFGAKIYMRLVDNETAEGATKLAGESDWKVISGGTSIGKDGSSTSRQRELRERKNLPSTILTQVLKKGEAVVIGSLDGGETRPSTYFLRVPPPDDGEFARRGASKSGLHPVAEVANARA
jgi:hypothetical protein